MAEGQDAGGAWVDARLRGDERATRFTGRYLIACNGGASPIRTRLGIGLDDLDFHEPWLVVDVVDERMLAEQGGGVRTSYRQNIIPPLKHGLIAADSPGAGTLFPQPDVRASNVEGRLDDFTGCGTAASAAEALALLQDFLRRLRD